MGQTGYPGFSTASGLLVDCRSLVDTLADAVANLRAGGYLKQFEGAEAAQDAQIGALYSQYVDPAARPGGLCIVWGPGARGASCRGMSRGGTGSIRWGAAAQPSACLVDTLKRPPNEAASTDATGAGTRHAVCQGGRYQTGGVPASDCSSPAFIACLWRTWTRLVIGHASQVMHTSHT